MQTNDLTQLEHAFLKRAIIVEQDLWQAVCINCFDLVASGASNCSKTLNYIVAIALKIAHALNLPAVIWATNCQQEQALAAQLVASNHQIKTPQQLLNG